MRKIMTPELIAKGNELRALGMSNYQVADRLGCSENSIRAHCRAGAASMAEKVKATKDRDDQIRADRLTGATRQELAEKYGLSLTSVETIIRGLKLSKEQKKRCYQKQHDVSTFETFDAVQACDDFVAALAATGGGSYASVNIPSSSTPKRIHGLGNASVTGSSAALCADPV